jgi:hypothetical protein
VFGRPVVDRYYQTLIDFARASGKAMVVSCGVPIAPEIHAALREGGIAVLDDPELCLRALGRVVVGCADSAPAGGPSAHPTSNVRVAVEHDRDFGDIVTLTAPDRAGRVVRALPASDDDLRDALHAIARSGQRRDEAIPERPSEQVVRDLRRFIASAAPGAETQLDLVEEA